MLEKTPGVVLIDEIDLHLHPQWQQTILSDLHAIFPEVQFIVSSHAPAVINSVPREQIRILDHGGSICLRHRPMEEMQILSYERL